MARHYVKNRNPQTPRELAEVLASPAAAAEVFGGSPESWAAFEQEYAAASPLVDQIAEERAQVRELEALRGQRGRAQVPRGIGFDPAPMGARTSKLYNKNAPGIKLDGVLPESEYPWAQFIATINPKNEARQPQRTQIHNAMGERIPSGGGFLVPELLRSNLLELALEQTIIRQRALPVTMDSLRIPFPAIDDPSHETTVYGGVTAFWVEESAAIQQSAPSFARVVLEAKKLAGFTAIPNELLADNAQEMLQAWLENSWPAALAYFEDDGFINGTGTGEPQGFLNAPAAIKVPTATTNVITLPDIIAAYCRMLPQALEGAVWLCSPDVKQQLLSLAFLVTISATKSAISPPAWLAGLSAIAEEPSTLFGKPVITCEKMPSATSVNTTTAGALSLANFRYYLLGDRQRMELAMSQAYLFQNDQTAWRMIERCDGRVWPQTAQQPRNGGPTLSPFVLVDTTS